MRSRRTRRLTILVSALTLALTGCGGAGTESAGQPAETTATAIETTATAERREAAATPAEPSGTLRLYSTVTQETVDTVIAAYGERHPEVEVELFRAPTGELNARVAAEQRDGEIQADLFWLTDPLSMQTFDAQGLLAEWTPVEVDAVPAEYRTERSWGTRLLNLVIVHRAGLDPAPTSWDDLTDPAYQGAVAVPDPGFAGSAFGALGYFAERDGGLDFYRALADNGAVQVRSPGEVTTGVAEGRFAAGITLDADARAAAEAGSPVELVVPEPGAIAVYSPIAVLDTSANREAAESFVDFTLSPAAQEAIAATGWQPIRDDVDWPHDAAQVAPDWPAITDRQDELLEEYRTIFGG